LDFDNGIVIANSSTAITYTAGSAGDLLVDVLYDGIVKNQKTIEFDNNFNIDYTFRNAYFDFETAHYLHYLACLMMTMKMIQNAYLKCCF
jgi:hypothetical protein